MRRRAHRGADDALAVERDREVRVLAVQPWLRPETGRQPEDQVVLSLALEQEVAGSLEERGRVLVTF